MNARFLATFCAVARFGSLNAAARHLGLSSASAGEQIKALEKDLNARLLSRHGRLPCLAALGCIAGGDKQGGGGENGDFDRIHGVPPQVI